LAVVIDLFSRRVVGWSLAPSLHKVIAWITRHRSAALHAGGGEFLCDLEEGVDSPERFETRKEARLSVFEWIEVWYNRKRRHSSLGYLSPMEFEKRHEEK
jgi:transposase InsO family protein